MSSARANQGSSHDKIIVRHVLPSDTRTQVPCQVLGVRNVTFSLSSEKFCRQAIQLGTDTISSLSIGILLDRSIDQAVNLSVNTQLALYYQQSSFRCSIHRALVRSSRSRQYLDHKETLSLTFQFSLTNLDSSNEYTHCLRTTTL